MKENRHKTVLSLDILPMAEEHHTGISNVSKFLARELLGDPSVEPRFFAAHTNVMPSLVDKLVHLDHGDIIWWLRDHVSTAEPCDVELGRSAAAVYTAAKTSRKRFPVEAYIVHDLTAVITPQFHTAGAVEYWSSRLLGDILSSDLVVAVSESTLRDIRDYYPQAAHIPGISVPLAPCVSGQMPGAIRDRPVEEYIVVLGTVEPRKNIEGVLECLKLFPGLLACYRFVFVGRWGWGSKSAEILKRSGLSGYAEAGRIVFTGFVSDEVRDALISKALCVVYPSRYEGFGLPILEALHFGTPVVSSFSSSIPEVGGPVAEYFDLNSGASLGSALERALSLSSQKNAHARREWAARFTWSLSYRKIRDAILNILG